LKSTSVRRGEPPIAASRLSIFPRTLPQIAAHKLCGALLSSISTIRQRDKHADKTTSSLKKTLLQSSGPEASPEEPITEPTLKELVDALEVSRE